MKHYTDWDDFMIHKRKFSDSDFLEYYHRGLSDYAIAKIFNCKQTCVRVRRMKIGLIANFKSYRGKILNVVELQDALKRRSKQNVMKRRTRIQEDSAYREELQEADRVHHKKTYQKDKRHERYRRSQEKLVIEQ